MLRKIKKSNKKKIGARDILIISFSIAFFVVLTRIFFERNIIIDGLSPLIGILVGFLLIKLFRKENKR